MKIKLTVFERLVTSGLVPSKSSYYEQEAIRRTSESLSLSMEEHKLFKPYIISEAEDRLNARWSEVNLVIPEKEVEFSDWLFDKIKDDLKKDSDAENLTMDKHTLYEKFVRKSGEDEDEPDK